MVSKWRKRQAEEESRRNAEKLFYEIFDEVFLYNETLWIYGFRKATEESGDPYGAERMERAYWTVLKEYKRMVERYQYGTDDSHYFAMQQELLAKGIDVKAWQEEAERRYPNGVKRETKRWGEK